MSAPDQKLSPGRRAAFTVAMVLLPVLFFAALEGGLRLADYGDSYPLFVPVPGHDSLMTQNREVARRYFTSQERAPTGIADVFSAEKPVSAIRVVVQGGSSAAGYPYYYGGSFSRMLEQRLLQTFPERHVEVINTAMAAVNSYTLLDLADEIVAIEPDVVLIYAGHNEYYGALGVGSAQSLGRSRTLVVTLLSLQRWRTVQLLRAGLARLAALTAGREPGSVPGSTLMERMVGEQSIPLGSDLYQAGLDQFAGNLNALLGRYREAGIDVVVATVASNERDHPPFQSRPDPTLNADAFARELSRGRSLAARGDTAAAWVIADSLAAVDDYSADLAFLRARLLDHHPTFDAARAAYLAAKDRDELRFRAPEAINVAIRQVAARQGATVVDVQRVLRESAQGGIIDGSLMLEHLHPNTEGYFLMADAFYQALRDREDFGSWERAVPRAQARGEILLTQVDSLYGAYRLMQLTGSWPFAPPGVVDTSTDTLIARTVPQELALQLFRREMSWFEATNRLQAWYMDQGHWRDALKASLAIIQQFPFLAPPYATAGDALLRQRRTDEALIYYEEAIRREESPRLRMVIGEVHAALGRHDQAAQAYGRAFELEPANAEAALRLGRSLVIEGDTTAAIEVLERLLERVPDERRARNALNFLSGRAS